MSELQLAVLTRPLPEYELQVGDVGTIVHVYADAKGYEVEFVTGNGDPVALVTLSSDDMRPFDNHEILHVRSVAA